MSDWEAVVLICAALGTRWHRSITSSEALGNPREALGTSRASFAFASGSLGTSCESRGAPREAVRRISSSILVTCALLGNGRASLVEASAALVLVSASIDVPLASIVYSWDDARTPRASVVETRAAGREIETSLDSFRASLDVSRASLVTSRASLGASRASLRASSDAPAGATHCFASSRWPEGFLRDHPSNVEHGTERTGAHLPDCARPRAMLPFWRARLEATSHSPADSALFGAARALLCGRHMQDGSGTDARDSAVSRDASGYWTALFYCWFVESNPLYLVSATLVLAGCSLWSRGLVASDGLAGPLGIASVAELYALSLVAGAALLVRVRLPRPAVMLAFLSLLYQWDMTLHTETCAYLGAAGAWATVAWLALFTGKLRALSWALRLRVAPRVVAALLVAGGGLALGPRVLPGLGARYAGALLAGWLFTLGSLCGRGGIESLENLDGWGRTVQRRAVRAAWLLSGVLVGAHVLIWYRDHDISLWPSLLAAPLLVLRRGQSESRVWATAVGSLVFAALAAPGAFFITSLLAAAALTLRALGTALASSAESARAAEPYRTGGADTAPRASADDAAPASTAAERARLLTGALTGVYLAAWTVGWSSGPWPAHALAVDAVLQSSASRLAAIADPA